MLGKIYTLQLSDNNPILPPENYKVLADGVGDLSVWFENKCKFDSNFQEKASNSQMDFIESENIFFHFDNN
jgi:hypothetical protein